MILFVISSFISRMNVFLRKLISFLQEHVMPLMDELQITMQEYVILKMIALFSSCMCIVGLSIPNFSRLIEWRSSWNREKGEESLCPAVDSLYQRSLWQFSRKLETQQGSETVRHAKGAQSKQFPFKLRKKNEDCRHLRQSNAQPDGIVEHRSNGSHPSLWYAC